MKNKVYNEHDTSDIYIYVIYKKSKVKIRKNNSFYNEEE